MRESEKFEEWFNSTFLFSRDPTSVILNSEHKTIEAKYKRIGEVCKRILDDPKKPTQQLREEIAVDFFISMRCALDYINYAKLVLAKWKDRKL
jgi:hypothetical protein